MSKQPSQSWRIVADEIIAATMADPESLSSIYDDKEFRPGRNASVWMQLSARLSQARKAYREAVAKRCLKEVQHTMLRRCFAHDYSSPGAYMITMAVPERGSNPFGVVKGDVRLGRMGITVMPEEVWQYASLRHGEGPLRLELTPLGAAVLKALEGIPANYPMVEVRKAQVMPDHIHLILFVSAPIVSSNGKERHLGHVIAGYKTGCNKARRLMVWQHNCQTLGGTQGTKQAQGVVLAQGVVQSQGTKQAQGVEKLCFSTKESQFPTAPQATNDGSAMVSDPQFKAIWADGYTDTIIVNTRHMATEVAYLDDNIYRLRMKQLHRDLFRQVHHIRINGHDFAALGNIHLLRRPRKEQVQYHRWEASDQKALSEHTQRLMKAGDEGAVFVSPFISETEKAIRNAALTMGMPYIRLTREGFRDLYTPNKSEFEACCEGNLLLLAPWEERRRTSTITRRECLALNDIAAMIAADELSLTWVRNGQNDNENTIIPRDDE